MVDLAELSQIHGVLDSLLYNRWGELVIPELQYKDARISTLGTEIAYCWTFLERMQKKVDFIELVYQDRRIIARLSDNFLILVVCGQRADVPLIKLTMNVINEEIKGDREIQRLLRRSRGKRDLLIEAQREIEWKELSEKMSIHD